MSIDPNKLPLNFDNFFPHLIIHPKDAEENDRNLTWAVSIILGIFTVGLVHLGCALYEHFSNNAEVKTKDNQTGTEQRTDREAQEALGKISSSSTTTTLTPKSQPEPAQPKQDPATKPAQAKGPAAAPTPATTPTRAGTPAEKKLPYPKLTFSKEILDNKNFPIPEICLQKYADEKSGIFQPLATFLKSLTLNPPLDLDQTTPFELLMTAMLLSQGHFSRSDNKSNWDGEPFIQIKVFEVLDPLVTQLFSDENLPLPFRQEMRSQYIYCMDCCLLDSGRRVLINQIGKAQVNALNDSFVKVKVGENLISVAEPLKVFIEAFKTESIPKELFLVINVPKYYALEHALASMGLEKTPSHDLVKDLVVEIEGKTKRWLDTGFMYPAHKDGRVACYSKDGYRMAMFILQMTGTHQAFYTQEFEKVFPGEDFKKYRLGLLNLPVPKLSPSPALFEIPLLAEALGVRVECHIMDEKGHVGVEVSGPEDAKHAFGVAFRKEYNSGFYLYHMKIAS